MITKCKRNVIKRKIRVSVILKSEFVDNRKKAPFTRKNRIYIIKV